MDYCKGIFLIIRKLNNSSSKDSKCFNLEFYSVLTLKPQICLNHETQSIYWLFIRVTEISSGG